MGELIFYIIVFIVVSGLIMVGTKFIYDLSAAIITVVAVLMIIIGIVFGFVVAIRNTFSVYKKVYMKRGK